jgi:hypothetical protein
VQPTGYVSVAADLRTGLECCHNAALGAVDADNGRAFTVNGNYKRQIFFGETAFAVSPNDSIYRAVNTRQTAQPWSLLIDVVLTAAPSGSSGFMQVASTAVNSSSPWIIIQANGSALRIYAGGSYLITTASGFLLNGRRYRIAANYDGTKVQLFCNGARIGSYSSTNLGTKTSTHCWFGNGYFNDALAAHFMGAYWTRCVPDNRMLGLTVNSWTFFEQGQDVINLAAGGGGGGGADQSGFFALM